MDQQAERQAVIAAARSWWRTPYHDQSRVKGAGVDCLMFIVAAFEESGIEPPISVPYYSPQWLLHQDQELYLAGVLERCVEITEIEAKPADIVLYKIARCFAHGAIIIEWPTIIHAYKNEGCVTIGDGTLGDLGTLGNKQRPRRFFTRKAWRA